MKQAAHDSFLPHDIVLLRFQLSIQMFMLRLLQQRASGALVPIGKVVEQVSALNPWRISFCAVASAAPEPGLRAGRLLSDDASDILRDVEKGNDASSGRRNERSIIVRHFLVILKRRQCSCFACNTGFVSLEKGTASELCTCHFITYICSTVKLQDETHIALIPETLRNSCVDVPSQSVTGTPPSSALPVVLANLCTCLKS